MAQEKTILVATVAHPERRFRIAKTSFDKANAEAKEAGKKSPFIVQKEGCEGGPTYDDLSNTGKKKVDKAQADRQAVIDAKKAEEEEAEEEEAEEEE